MAIALSTASTSSGVNSTMYLSLPSLKLSEVQHSSPARKSGNLSTLLFFGICDFGPMIFPAMFPIWFDDRMEGHKRTAQKVLVQDAYRLCRAQANDGDEITLNNSGDRVNGNGEKIGPPEFAAPYGVFADGLPELRLCVLAFQSRPRSWQP